MMPVKHLMVLLGVMGGLCGVSIANAFGHHGPPPAPAPAPVVTEPQDVTLYAVSREPVILAALTDLEHTSAAASVEYMRHHEVRVLFKDMSQLGAIYMTHDALTIITDSDQQIIFINARHRIAPPEALAALIGHEILHNDRENSVDEETFAWTREGQLWSELRSQHPQLAAVKTGQIPLVDRENAIMILMRQNKLPLEIQSNVAYKNLPEHSTGY